MKRNVLLKLALLGMLIVLSLGVWRYGMQMQSDNAPNTAGRSSTAPHSSTAPYRMIPQHRSLRWRAASATEKAGAIKSITAQLEAFKRDDFVSASRFQSADLQRNFASAERFRAMMKSSYPQFCNYKTVRFGPARVLQNDGSVQIPIELTGADGGKVIAEYSMIKEKDGQYRVSGVSGGTPSNPSHDNEPQDDFPPPVPDDSQSGEAGANI